MNPNMSFQKSLKPMAIEEFLDYYFYRRVAFQLLPFLQRLKLTPNQVTTLSMLFGLVASFLVYHQYFFLACLWAVFAIFLDCSDGQLARLTGQTSPYGRVLDGVCDMVWVTAFWLAVYFSGYFQELGFANIFWLMLPSSISMIVHCWRFDGVKVQYLEVCGETFSDQDIDVYESLQKGKAAFKKRNFFEAFLMASSAFQGYFFGRGNKKKKQCQRTSEEATLIRSQLEPVLDHWSWLGEGHHNTLVILGVFLAAWTPYGLIGAFWAVFLPMNFWWLYCEWQWFQAIKRVEDVI